MLAWTREELSKASGVPMRTLTRIEAGLVHRPHQGTLRSIIAAFAAAGVEFIPANGGGPGVRLSREAALREALALAKGG
jgi:transcriptional regulator with XRE-family HTH domain